MKLWEKLVGVLGLSAVMTTFVIQRVEDPHEGVRLSRDAAARINEADKPEIFTPAMGHRPEELPLQAKRYDRTGYMTLMREEGEEQTRQSNFIATLREAECFNSEPKDGIFPSNKPECQKGLPELRRIMQERWASANAHKGAPSVSELEAIYDFSEKIARISGGDDGVSALGLAPGELSKKLCSAAQSEYAFSQRAYNELSQRGGEENLSEYAATLGVLKNQQTRYCDHK